MKYSPLAPKFTLPGMVKEEPIVLGHDACEGNEAPIAVVLADCQPFELDHALAVEGPIREYYPVGLHETNDEDQWLTQVGWPIFDTRRAAARHQRKLTLN